MTFAIVLQFLVVLAAIWMGARSSGIGLGLWGAVGLLVLVAGFGINPTSPPIDVMLIILAVIMAASVMEAAGGIDFLVRIAERIIRANPKYVTIVAPLTTWTFTFVAGTGHIVYPLLPVIYETAHRSGIRPERPMAVATIASQQAITASPVAAATAARIGLFSQEGLTEWGLPRILMVCVPATNVKLHVVSGATMVTYFGLARMIRSAIRTRKSMPPAASITEAAMITARMISITSTGGDAGATPKPATSPSRPTAPHRPRPTPEKRAPIQMAASTTTNCRTIERVMVALLQAPASGATARTSG